MDTEQAMAYLRKAHAETDPQPAETAPNEGPTVPTGEQPVKPEPEPEPEVGTDREPAKADATETAVEQKPQQKKPSKQDKIDYAFKRQKQRHAAELEARDKRIAELEERVKKFAPLEQGDFDPNDVKSYIDHKFQLQNEQGELDRLKNERDQYESEQRRQEANERHYAQVNECFDTDDARNHYWNLIRNGGDRFREYLAEHDPDGTIDSFIGDSDVAPLLISTLMRNPEIRKAIVEKRSPMRKMLAMQQLENRLILSRKVGRNQASQQVATEQPKKPALPIIGSQVKQPGTSADVPVKDWNRYLAEHPRSGY